METEEQTGLFDVIFTPSGKFRTWRTTGEIECMVDDVWQSIPKPAQAEIRRLQEMASTTMFAPLGDSK